MSATTDAIVEQEAALEVVQKELEGARDFARTNINTAREVAQRAIVDYERRERLLQVSIAANAELRDDGHPDLPQRLVSGPEFRDLRDQLDTMNAFFSRVDNGEATALHGALGAVEPKP